LCPSQIRGSPRAGAQCGGGQRIVSGSWDDPEYWILVDNPLKVAEWCAAIDRKERACAGRELETSPSATQSENLIWGQVCQVGR
jgi:hypothetical protein